MADVPPQPIGIGVARVDGRGSCLFVNDEFGKILGFTREEMLGDGLRTLTPEVQGRIPERWDELRTGRTVTSVESYRRPDGREVTIRIDSMPELDANGRVVSIVLTCFDISEQQQTRSERERERQRTAEKLEELEDLYENTPVCLCVVDRNLRYVRSNHRYAEMVGRSPSDVVGRTMHEVLPPSVRDDAIAAARKALDGGGPLTHLEISTSPCAESGEERVWLVNVHPVVRDGRITGAMAAIQSVTDLRRAEAAATDRLKELEDVYEQTPAGLCVIDRELRYVRVNRRYARMVGHPRGEIIGRPIEEIMPPSTHDHAMDLARRVIGSGRAAFGEELRYRDPERPDLERVWLVNVHPVWRDGQVVGVLGALLNVTRLRRTEEEAQQRLRELEAVYANSPVGLVMMDRDLRYVRVNQAIADMNGIPIESVVGRTYRDLAPATADEAERLLRYVMEEGRSVRNVEARAHPPSDPGNEHIYLMSIDPLRDAEGEVIGLVSAVQDVTELRRVEQEASLRLAELELVYANAPVGLCHLDPQLRVRTMNARFASLCVDGGQEAPSGRLVADLLPGTIARQLVPRILEVARTGMSSLGNQVRGPRHGEGTSEHTWIAGIHPAKRDGEVVALVLVLQDVTPLMHRQRQLEAVRDRLTEAQRVAMVGSWEWSVLDDVMWWSPELYEIFGEPAGYEPSYLGFFEHVHREDRQQVRDQIESTVLDGEPHHLTCRVVRPDGSERALFTVARLERTPEGLPSRLIGTCQDITDFGPPGRMSVRRLWKKKG